MALDFPAAYSRTCPGCDATFTTRRPRQRFCPRCDEEITALGWKSDKDRTMTDAPLPTAPYILGQARDHLSARAATYDAPGGERSMAKAVAIFNATTGRDLTALEGWRFMLALKLARSAQDGYNPDDYEDLAAYAALAGEQAAEDRGDA